MAPCTILCNDVTSKCHKNLCYSVPSVFTVHVNYQFFKFICELQGEYLAHEVGTKTLAAVRQLFLRCDWNREPLLYVVHKIKVDLTLQFRPQNLVPWFLSCTTRYNPWALHVPLAAGSADCPLSHYRELLHWNHWWPGFDEICYTVLVISVYCCWHGLEVRSVSMLDFLCRVSL